VRVRSGETPRSPVVEPPCVVESRVRSGAEQLTSPQYEVKPAASLRRSVSARTRRSRALPHWAKAMDGTRELGAGAEGPPGAGGVEWSEGCPWNWRDPSRRRHLKATGRQLVVPGSIDTDNQRTWETAKCRAEVGGGRSSDDDRDNITRPERRASSQVCDDQRRPWDCLSGYQPTRPRRCRLRTASDAWVTRQRRWHGGMRLIDGLGESRVRGVS
jgi:hypothetical protein